MAKTNPFGAKPKPTPKQEQTLEAQRAQLQRMKLDARDAARNKETGNE